MKRVTFLNEDEIVIDKRELLLLLFDCRSAFQNGSNAFVWFETPNEKQQELRDRYSEIFSNRADQINMFLEGLD